MYFNSISYFYKLTRYTKTKQYYENCTWKNNCSNLIKSKQLFNNNNIICIYILESYLSRIEVYDKVIKYKCIM